MILPDEQFNNAVVLGKKWLEEGAEIVFVHENGVVLRKEGHELTIRLQPRLAAFAEVGATHV